MVDQDCNSSFNFPDHFKDLICLSEYINVNCACNERGLTGLSYSGFIKKVHEIINQNVVF